MTHTHVLIALMAGAFSFASKSAGRVELRNNVVKLSLYFAAIRAASAFFE
jgi:hypothetical protein